PAPAAPSPRPTHDRYTPPIAPAACAPVRACSTPSSCPATPAPRPVPPPCAAPAAAAARPGRHSESLAPRRSNPVPPGRPPPCPLLSFPSSSPFPQLMPLLVFRLPWPSLLAG